MKHKTSNKPTDQLSHKRFFVFFFGGGDKNAFLTFSYLFHNVYYIYAWEPDTSAIRHFGSEILRHHKIGAEV